MTTNQTIDGVRKLAEQACGTSPDSPAYRRFIAAMNPTLLLDLTSPSAQPQGATSEVIAFGIQVEKLLCDALGREWSASGISIESLVAELRGKPQGEPVAELQVAFFEHGPMATINWFTPSAFEPGATKLYAEQPAPVAVLLPEHRDSDLRSPVFGFAKGWNACLDEATRLNTK